VAVDGDLGDGSSWEPRIVAFLCNWCSYTGADLAGTNRIAYPATVRIIRLPCTGRVDPVFVLQSFQRGADGVLVSGCHPAECHHGEGNLYARRRIRTFRSLLEFVGIDPRRVQMSWVAADEGEKWAEVVSVMTRDIEALGPLIRRETGSAGHH